MAKKKDVKMVTCPSCGFENVPETDGFCPECAEDMPNPKAAKAPEPKTEPVETPPATTEEGYEVGTDLTEQDLIDAATDLNECLNLEPALATDLEQEEMKAALLGAADLLTWEDVVAARAFPTNTPVRTRHDPRGNPVLAIETIQVLEALGWVAPEPPVKGKKDKAAKKAKTPKAPKAPKAKKEPRRKTDWAGDSLGLTHRLIKLVVQNPAATKNQIAALYQEQYGEEPQKGTLGTQYSTAHQAMACAAALDILK